MGKLKFYYDYGRNTEIEVSFFEKKLEVLFPNCYREFLSQDGGILYKNKYFYKDVYMKDACNRIINIYRIHKIEKLIVDGDFDNYLIIGETSNITCKDHDIFSLGDQEYLTINLLDGSICVYDQSTNHPIAKSFNKFVNNIVYD